MPRKMAMLIGSSIIETTDSKDYAKNIATFADAGYKVIVTTGFNLTEPTYAAAKLYPEDPVHRR